MKENQNTNDFENLANTPIIADEEDLTLVNSGEDQILKFKDRNYDTNEYSGLGFKILRKRVLSGKNILQSSDFLANHIIEIRYDFDLGGATITLPQNIILKFRGGALKNGTIVGNGTRIDANIYQIFATDIVFSGDWIIASVYAEWFGAKTVFVNSNNNDTEAVSSPKLKPPASVDALPDSSVAINKALELVTKSGSTLEILSRFYKITNTIKMPMKSKINLHGDAIIFAYMEGLGNQIIEQNPETNALTTLPLQNEKIFQIAPNQFFAPDAMKIAIEMSPQQTQITGRGTLSLVRSRYTIGLLLRGTGYHYLDMSYGTPDIDIRVVAGIDGTYAPDCRDGIGSNPPSDVTGVQGNYYWDKLNKVYYRRDTAKWTAISAVGKSDPLFNVALRVDVGQGWSSGRLIDPQVSLWAMYGWRGIEIYTHDGGWFNEGVWSGTVSNFHGSYVSIFTTYDVVNHDMRKITFQTDNKMQYDARILQVIKGGGIQLGTVWDMSWIQVKCEYAFYLGKFTKKIQLTSIDKYRYVLDLGINNMYKILPDFTDLTSLSFNNYRNLLAYRTPQSKMVLSGLSTQYYFELGEIMTVQQIENLIPSKNGTYINAPKQMYDCDPSTFARVIDVANNKFGIAFSILKNDQGIRCPITKNKNGLFLVIEYGYDGLNSLVAYRDKYPTLHIKNGGGVWFYSPDRIRT